MDARPPTSAPTSAPTSTLEQAPAAPGWLSRLNPAQIILLLLLIAYPFTVNDFWVVQIGAQSLFLGVIALSLMFLAGYGGMVSLAQMTVAGVAGYMVAILGQWVPWWVTLPAALLIGTAFATLVGALAVRTAGIYTIMITLAVGVAFFYFARQNYAIFNGFNGFSGLKPPPVFGVDWRAPLPFYYLCLGVATLAYAGVLYLSRSPFGIALQAIRDNPRRMRALGFNVTVHSILAHTAAGVIASFGGLLLVWFNGRISPGTIEVTPIISILIIAVLGGLRHPLGPFLGAVVYVLLQNFAIDLIDRERFNTVIGLAFLAIVFFSPDGLLGLWQRARRRLDTTTDQGR